MNLKSIEYADGEIRLLDQRKLPSQVEYITVSSTEKVCSAIKDMSIRGAPAIGVCAAFGVCIAAQECGSDMEKLYELARKIRSSRPTAVNLAWAVDRMLEAVHKPGDLIRNLESEAKAIMQEDIEINKSIGENLLKLLPENGCILTYCNAGALATAGYGTALSPVYLGLERGRKFKVYACETRPLLQGARLTALELREAGADVTVICDNNAANILKSGEVDAIITGCDRVAANGDTANKVGTFSLSIMAGYFDIPFYIAAPTPSIDFAADSGDNIIIEQRDEQEVTALHGKRTVPEGVAAHNPAFDITPAVNITAFATEKGIFKPDELSRLRNGMRIENE